MNHTQRLVAELTITAALSLLTGQSLNRKANAAVQAWQQTAQAQQELVVIARERLEVERYCAVIAKGYK